MSDLSNDEKPAKRPSPASRARRIGGRPAPAPTPPPAPDQAPAPAVEVRKPTHRPAPQPAPDSHAQPAAEPQQTRAVPMSWLPAVVLGIGAVVLLVLLVISSHGVYWAKADASANSRTVRQEQVLAAAKKCFAQINSYDYRRLDGLVSQDLACTTGTFTHDLRQTLQTQILKLAPKLKATQTAQVNRAGVISVSPSGNQVVTLIYGQLAQSNSTTAKQSPRIDVVGAVVTVDKVGDRWLIAKVDTDVGNSLGS